MSSPGLARAGSLVAYATAVGTPEPADGRDDVAGRQFREFFGQFFSFFYLFIIRKKKDK